jgi:hypothetical protein
MRKLVGLFYSIAHSGSLIYRHTANCEAFIYPDNLRFENPKDQDRDATVSLAKTVCCDSVTPLSSI